MRSQMHYNVMVDLETLSTARNACIVSIGAVFFDPITGQKGNKFYRVLDIDSNLKYGRHISGDTLTWWMNQSNQAKLIFSENTNKTNLKEALVSFNRFLKSSENVSLVKFWANSPNFDEVILHSAMQATGVPWLLEFWNTRCVRTVKALCPEETFKTWENNNPREGYHNALSDAEYQADYTSWILRSSGCKELC